MELENIQRIAIFKMRNIGDVLMMTPALRALRETFPQAHITAIVNSGTEAMVANNPDLNDVVVFKRDVKDRGPLLRLAYEIDFARQLRKRRFDLTISFTEGDRSAWYSLFSGAKHRLGLLNRNWSRHGFRRRIYNMPAPASPASLHEVEKHFWILEKGGLKLTSTRPGSLCLVLPERTRDWARKELAALRPARIVHVHPVARWLWKCWEKESMAAVIDWLREEAHCRVVMTTGPIERERKLAREIFSLCRFKPTFFDGTLSLEQTAALSAEADLYFGVDTAPTHMAAAVGAPVLVLFGPTNPVSWSPWSPRGRVLFHPCPCNKTHKRACDWTQVRACLKAITVPEVEEALRHMLATPRSEVVANS